MHLVDSTSKRQPEDRGASSPALPLQRLPSGEKLPRQSDGDVEVINVNGAEIRLRKFMAPDAGGPVALYLHGIEGHSLWFANTASLLNKSGISVYAPDRRGAGLNTYQRGHVKDADQLLIDVEFFLHLIAEKHPQQSIFILANCWGAKLGAIVASKTYKWSSQFAKVPLSGLVLICPAIKTKPDLSLIQKLSIAAALIMRGNALQSEFPIPLTCSMFTDNPLYLNYIESDPYRLISASKAFYFASWLLSLRSLGAAGNIDLPTLILQSDNDAIVDVPGLESWFKRVDCKDKKLQIYEKAAHSLDFDNRHFFDYANEISGWITARSAKRGAS
ncbi:MAG: alpha/beta fold hydrolase [Candidatus Melainabacteria bacterium]|jgi:acylglycerol lipase|nr:alpha/beta fold hydrolase [Candidatus Melainabacteria bacterium]